MPQEWRPRLARLCRPAMPNLWVSPRFRTGGGHGHEEGRMPAVWLHGSAGSVEQLLATVPNARQRHLVLASWSRYRCGLLPAAAVVSLTTDSPCTDGIELVLRRSVDAWRLIATDSEMHMTEEPESANRWATEHYGFDDHAARPEGRVNDATALPARPTPTQRGTRRPRPRTALIASAVVSVA